MNIKPNFGIIKIPCKQQRIGHKGEIELKKRKER